MLILLLAALLQEPVEAAALERITLGRVTETISFLAADELEGRDTSSVGLTVAGAYVAARFRGLGLQGAGAEGSYYLPSTVEVAPREGIVLEAKGQAIAWQGLLVARQELRLTGPIPLVEKLPNRVEAAVALDEGRAARGLPDDLAAVLWLRDQARLARQRGAKALLVHTKEGSVLRALAMEVLEKPASGRAGSALAQVTLPVLLLGEERLPEGEIVLGLPAARRVPGDNRNVAAILPGSDPALKDSFVVFSAHLDHVGKRGQDSAGDTIFNGADDDASGVTGVLLLAEAFAALKAPPKRSLVFVTFWGEERGLLGSRDFVRNPPVPLEKIVCNVNLEMLGRPEEGARHKTWMTGWTESDLGELLARGAARHGIEVFHHPRYSRMLYRSSDNASFVDKGIIAHSFSAGSLHQDYHKPGDEWQKLDLPHMTKVIQGLFAGALPIAEGELTPAKKERS